MDERRDQPMTDIPPESGIPPVPGGEPPPAARVAPPATGDPVVDADPEGSRAAPRPYGAIGAGPVDEAPVTPAPRRSADEPVDQPGPPDRSSGGIPGWRDPDVRSEAVAGPAVRTPAGDTGVTDTTGGDAPVADTSTTDDASPALAADALAGATAGVAGALAGGAIAGPAGAIVGGVVGAVGGAAVTEASAPYDEGRAARPESDPDAGAAGLTGTAGRERQNPDGTWTAAVSDPHALGEAGTTPPDEAEIERTGDEPPDGIEPMV